MSEFEKIELSSLILGFWTIVGLVAWHFIAKFW